MKTVVTKYTGICVFCGRPAEATHHLIGGPNRGLADEDGLTVPVCHFCHNMAKSLSGKKSGTQNTTVIHGNSKAEIMSKMMGQLAWEKEYYKKDYINVHGAEGGDDDPARSAFLSRYGRSYL